MQVNIYEAKSQLSQLIRSACAGDEVVIANRGAPLVRLVAVDGDALPAVSGNRNFLKWLKENPLPAHAQRTAAEIDAAIAAERDAWD